MRPPAQRTVKTRPSVPQVGSGWLATAAWAGVAPRSCVARATARATAIQRGRRVDRTEDAGMDTSRRLTVHLPRAWDQRLNLVWVEAVGRLNTPDRLVTSSFPAQGR